MKTKSLFTLPTLVVLATLNSQFSALLAFTNINAGLRGVAYASAAWGDYDNDGRLDILLSGSDNTNEITQVWRNTGNGFTNINAGLRGVVNSSVAWGDYDNDGRLDILLCGTDFFNTNTITQVWRNTGGGGFANINAGLPGVYNGSVAWGDYDNDGRSDILLCGTDITGTNQITQVWRNTANGFVNIGAGLPGVFAASVAWGDYDNDGRLDILLTGSTGSDFISQIWHNTGSGFTNINANLPGIAGASVAWGDYDNDGRLDILLTGFNLTNNTPISQVWRNTGSGFVNIIAGLTGVLYSSSAWGDYDNDGLLDIVLCGTDFTFTNKLTQIWRNTGSGFVNIGAGLPGVYVGSVAWGDYDNDGRLDLLLAGATNNDQIGNPTGFISQVLRNDTLLSNSPPSAPSGLNLTSSNLTATLTWNASADDVTPANGLTYNVRIGTTPGGSDVLAPMAGTNGFRRLPKLGNTQNGLTATFNYTLGTAYYWSVQAVDGAFAGGPFAAESSFTVLPRLSIALAGTNATISWQPPTTNWVLQQTLNLVPAAWSNSPSGSTNPISIPATNTMKYFRLFKP